MMNLPDSDVPETAESELPTGTVTFLLTDVEGSTKLWEAGPDETAASIARHYEQRRSGALIAGGSQPVCARTAVCATTAVEQGEGRPSVVGVRDGIRMGRIDWVARRARRAAPWIARNAAGRRPA